MSFVPPPAVQPWPTLIVEEQAICRRLFGYYVEHDPRFQLVGEAASGPEALATWRRLRPQLMLIDLGPTGTSGLDLAMQLRAAGCESRLLAITMPAGGHAVSLALTAGFHGFVFKSDPFTELIAAFACVAQGGIYLSAKARRLHEDYLQETRERAQVLTKREEQVLRLAASGLTNQAISIDLKLSVRTIESHRYHLMHKLGLKDTASLVNYAIRQGWSAA